MKPYHILLQAVMFGTRNLAIAQAATSTLPTLQELFPEYFEEYTAIKEASQTDQTWYQWLGRKLRAEGTKPTKEEAQQKQKAREQQEYLSKLIKHVMKTEIAAIPALQQEISSMKRDIQTNRNLIDNALTEIREFNKLNQGKGSK